MKISRKIVLLWSSTLLLYLISLLVFPHKSATIPALLNRVTQTLLLFISVFIFLKEPNRKNRFIFLNFVVLFSFCLVQYVYDFVGVAIFADAKYARHLFAQYFSLGWVFFQSVVILYLVFDLLYHEKKTYLKYLFSVGTATVLCAMLFLPYFSDPLYLYSTEDIKQWKTLSKAVSAQDHSITAGELANRVTLQTWSHGVAVGDLYPEQNYKRIESLLPYLEGDNWMVLLWKPFHDNMILLNSLLISAILVFFAYQYRKDPPQGAYIDKIMFLLLFFCSMEIAHYWGFMKSVEWGSWNDLFAMGQYVTVLIEILMVLFFGLRLRFITSVQGEFYESEIATNPTRISRWRDWVDEMVLAHFFNWKLFNGRLFQNTAEK